MTRDPDLRLAAPGSAAGETADDWLEAALAAGGHEHRADYLADDGFTARVMAALPVPATAPAWRKPALAVLWAAAGIGGAFALPGAFTELAREFFRIVGGHPVTLVEIAAAIAVVGAATWSATAWLLRSD